MKKEPKIPIREVASFDVNNYSQNYLQWGLNYGVQDKKTGVILSVNFSGLTMEEIQGEKIIPFRLRAKKFLLRSLKKKNISLETLIPLPDIRGADVRIFMV